MCHNGSCGVHKAMGYHFHPLMPSPQEKICDPLIWLLWLEGWLMWGVGLHFLETLGLGIKAKDNQSRYEVVRDFRAHLQQVYADRSLEEWLQARLNIFTMQCNNIWLSMRSTQPQLPTHWSIGAAGPESLWKPRWPDSHPYGNLDLTYGGNPVRMSMCDLVFTCGAKNGNLGWNGSKQMGTTKTPSYCHLQRDAEICSPSLQITLRMDSQCFPRFVLGRAWC